MKSIYAVFAVSLAAVACPLAAPAQDDDQVTENIVVVGEKSTAQMRRDVFEAEEEFYAIYNELNDDDDYDVSCFYEKATGTNIKNHVCRAKFVSKAYSRAASRNRNDLSRVANQDANPDFAKKTAIYQEKLESLISANPHLQEALVRYNTARADFMAVREAKN